MQNLSDNDFKDVPHFKRSSIMHPLSAHIKMVMEEKPYTLPHPIWLVFNAMKFLYKFSLIRTEEELNSIEITHVKPSLFVDKVS